MKKKTCMILILVVLLTTLIPCFYGCNKENETVFKIFNVQDYLQEDIVKDFEKYYEEKTGKNIRIQYDTFDTLERAYTIINNRKADYDIVCPSDYLIEKMIKNDLLQQINKDKIPNLKNIAPYLLNRNFDPENVYSIPYTWGTLGILYNADIVNPEDVGSWDLLWNENYKDKILMKDSIRDSVFIATIYANRKELKELKKNAKPEVYRKRIFELTNNFNEEYIKIVEKELREQYGILYGYEVDSGKDAMVNGEAYINLAWSGDAVWAIESAMTNGINLKYYIPEEGSNIWFDNWVIPKNGKNVDIAHEFMNFMCKPDIALKNSKEIGYTSAVVSPEILNYYVDEDLENGKDFSYLFNNTDSSFDLTNLKIDEVYYPTKDTIDYCVEMSDFGDKQDMVVKMWTRVKASPLSIEVKIFSILLAIAIVILIGYGIYKKIKIKKQRIS